MHNVLIYNYSSETFNNNNTLELSYYGLQKYSFTVSMAKLVCIQLWAKVVCIQLCNHKAVVLIKVHVCVRIVCYVVTIGLYMS